MAESHESETVTVDGIECQVSFSPLAVERLYGAVPEWVEVDRLFRYDDRIVGDRGRDDGSILEVSYHDDGTPFSVHVIDASTKSDVDPAESLLWQRVEDGGDR